MTHQLYDFQEETIFHLQNSQYKRECVCINTGGGKTFLFAAFAMMELSEGRKSLILVPRIELLQQAFDEFKMNFGYEPKLIEAGYRCAPQESHGVYIAMVETLYRRNALVKQLQKEITNLIVDECHLASNFKLLSTDWKRIIGFTATPQYQKKDESLGLYFQNIFIGADITQMLEKGYLVKPLTYAPSKLVNENFGDKLKLNKSRTDYDSEQMTQFFTEKKIFADVIENIKKYKKGRTLIYNSSIVHSEFVHRALLEEGYESYQVDSTTPKDERKAIIERFKHSENAIINNVNVLTFGFNNRLVETIILNRLTKSENLYIQMVGRGARSCIERNKENFILLDLFGNCTRHGLWEDYRDWEKKFFNIEKTNKDSCDAPVKLCPDCERVLPAQVKECPFCHHIFLKKENEIDVIKDELALVKREKIEAKVKKIMEQVREKGHKEYSALYKSVDFIFGRRGNKPKEVIEAELMMALESWVNIMSNKKMDTWHKNFVMNAYLKKFDEVTNKNQSQFSPL